MSRIVICDLDGTIALDNGRAKEHLHNPDKKRDWEAYFKDCPRDAPNWPVTDLLRSLQEQRVVVWILSGRSNIVRYETERWLREHQVPYTGMVMREKDDRTDDHILKIRWARELGFEPNNVWFILEDRKRVVDAWREAGYTCFEVAKGDF